MVKFDNVNRSITHWAARIPICVLFSREWSMPPTTYTYTRSSLDETTSETRQKVTLWKRFRVGVSQMFRRVAVFFRRRTKLRSTSSGGSNQWDSYGEEDSVDYLVSFRILTLNGLFWALIRLLINASEELDLALDSFRQVKAIRSG